MMKSAHVPKHISMRESHSIQTTEEIIYGPNPVLFFFSFSFFKVGSVRIAEAQFTFLYLEIGLSV